MSAAAIRSFIVMLVTVCATAPIASATVFSRDGWGWWIDEGGAASRGRGGTGIAVSGYGVTGAINPASIAGSDLSFGFASYCGSTTDVRGENGDFRQRQDRIPEFGGVIVLPEGLRAGIQFRAQTDASFERSEPLDGDPSSLDRHVTKGIGGWNRVQATLSGPALQGRLHWGIALGPTFGTVKEEHHYDFMPEHGADVRLRLVGRLRSAWSASAGLIARPDPRIRAGATFRLPGSSRLTQEIQVIEGTDLRRSTRGTQETPGQWGVGFWGEPHPRLSISADYIRTLWGEAGTRAEAGAAMENPYDDTQSWGVGLEFKSGTTPPQPPRWMLRAGYGESTSYVRSMTGEKVAERAASLGARLRAGKSRAAIDLAIERGIRGDRGLLGVEESFTRITLGVAYSSVKRDY